MSHSLRDQLLKAGLVNEKQAKKVKQEKRKKAKQQRNSKAGIVDENKLQAQQAQVEKAERDRQLNRRRQQESEQKAIEAQIKQLIEANRLSTEDGEVPFHFEDKKKIKRLHVSEPMQEQLARGRLAIVKLGARYEVVPVAVADKIRMRDERCVVVCNVARSGDEADDSYAEYQVPDDLRW